MDIAAHTVFAARNARTNVRRVDAETETILPGAAQTRILMLFAANLAIIVLVFLSTGRANVAAANILAADAMAGQALWQSRNCAACHALYGLGGHLGPDLTNAVSRIGDDGARAVIAYGLGKMPPQDLTAGEADRLVAYLRAVDATGVYPVGSFPDDAFGRARRP